MDDLEARVKLLEEQIRIIAQILRGDATSHIEEVYLRTELGKIGEEALDA